MDFVDAVRSDVDRVGSLARSAGSSRAACAARSARVSSSSALSSPALSRSRTALSSCSSAACSLAPSSGSGTRASVQRWRFSSTDSRRSSTKTAPPLRATSSLSEASAASKRRGSIGSRLRGAGTGHGRDTRGGRQGCRFFCDSARDTRLCLGEGRGPPVHPLGEGAHHEREALHRRGGRRAQPELDRVHRRLDRRLLEAALGDRVERLEDESRHQPLRLVAGSHALEADGEGGLLQRRAVPAADDCGAQLGGEQWLLQRRARLAEEQVVEHAPGQLLGRLERAGREEPPEGDKLRRRGSRGRVDGVRLRHLVRLRLCRLPRDLLIASAAGGAELGEPQLEQREALCGGQLGLVAVHVDLCVGGVVVPAVEVGKRVVRQRRDGARVAARVDRVDRVAAEERLFEGAVIELVRARVDALHLVEDHALVLERPPCVIDVIVPPLLLEDPRPLDWVKHAREKARVEIHRDEVEKVLLVLAGDRVHCPVRAGHRIQKGLERALEELDEGLLQRVSPRAAQHRVLEDVRHARVVLWERPEVAREDLVLVRGVDGEHLRRGRLVPVERRRQTSLGHTLAPHELKAV
mmetsp:Transcript_47425/g.153933  ORF Transcript_47425/g.153933 Transcript_47425/m.153933 type:complete len:580 (+) Transcript_47425:1475-3214(+)